MDTWIFIKPEIHTRKKTESSTNGTSQIGQVHVEEAKKIHNYHTAQKSTPLQVHQRTQHKAIYTKSDRRENKK